MAPLVHTVEIDRRPEDVFAYVTDPSRFPEWQDAVVSARPKAVVNCNRARGFC